MKLNIFLVLTIVLLVVLSLHTIMWISDVLNPESEGESTHYDLYEPEDLVFLAAFFILLILCIIGSLAYERTRRTSLGILSTAYAFLVIDSGMWLIEESYERQEILLSTTPLTNTLRAVLHILAIGLVAFALYKKRHGD